MRLWLAAASRFHRSIRAGPVPRSPDHDDRAVPARRRGRHRRASGGRGDGPRPQAAGGDREQGRRRRRHRHGPGREGEARRLHGAAGALVDHGAARGRQGAAAARRCTSSPTLRPIARFTADPTVLAVRADAPWKTLAGVRRGREEATRASSPTARRATTARCTCRWRCSRGDAGRQADARAVHRRGPGDRRRCSAARSTRSRPARRRSCST